MEYTTAMLIKRLGITRQMLRCYEREGLLEPDRIEHNGYRTYTNEDGFEILRIKDLQAHHFSLEKVGSYLNERTLSVQAEQIREVESRLQEQIRSLNAQMLRIQRHRMFIEDSMNEQGKVVEMDTYGIYRLMMLGVGITEDERHQEIASEWIRKMPFTEIGWSLAWPDSFADEEARIDAQIGLLAMPHCAFEQNLSTDEPVEFFPPGRSIRTMVSTADPFSVRIGDLRPLETYMKEHGYRRASGISGRYSGFTYENGEKRYCFSVRILVRNVKK